MQLVPSSDIPVGFLEGGALVHQETNIKTEDMTADESDYTAVRSRCAAKNATLLARADALCKEGVHRELTIQACVRDICLTGDPDFEWVEHELEILEVLEGDGVVAQEPRAGWCLDQSHRSYPSLSHLSMNTPKECRALLQEVGHIPGVQGAQLGPQRTCEIIFDAGSDASTGLKETAGGMWGGEHPGSGGTELVGSANGEPGWQCWTEL